jgi:tRNA U34 5-carboxymethylaminomethyl modifying enzyme MnmG/GidA
MSTAYFQRDLPVDSQYDVIVAGGAGRPAGCGAALAAARDGGAPTRLNWVPADPSCSSVSMTAG